jgi:allophanate hydrolase subunit 2
VPEQPGREGIAAVEADLSYLQDAFLDAWPGPEWESLPESMRAALLATTFTIHPDSNRMAVLLDHDSGLTAPEILTGPVEPGTIQLTPSGRTIVLMRDAQTTGGYARILQLGERAISALAQRRPRSAVRIRLHPGRPWEARTGP